MSALGLLLIMGGGLLIWSGFRKVNIFLVLRSIIGAPVGTQTGTGKLNPVPSGVSAKAV